MPYITEELWQQLPGADARLLHPAYANASPTIMLAAFPEPDEQLIDEKSEAEMQAVIDLVTRVRNIRSEMNIKPGERVTVLIGAPDQELREVFRASADQIARLARASEVRIDVQTNAPRASARAILADGAEVAIPLEGLIDFAQEQQRLGKEQEKLRSEAAKIEAQLANANFVERAPADKVNELRERIADIAQRATQLQQTVENLQ
jgi:valyl-tRNA synthetase